MVLVVSVVEQRIECGRAAGVSLPLRLYEAVGSAPITSDTLITR